MKPTCDVSSNSLVEGKPREHGFEFFELLQFQIGSICNLREMDIRKMREADRADNEIWTETI